MRLPWQRTENRSDSYTDAVVAEILRTAGGVVTANAAATAAIEAAAGAVGRAFAAATVESTDAVRGALPASTLGLVGRALIKRGEAVLVIDIAPGGGLRLLPASSWDVDGGYDPTTWVYNVDLAGPNGQTTRRVPAAGVVHVMFAVEPERPWAGVSPMKAASLAGQLSANVTAALGNEAGGAHGNLIAIPQGGGDANVAALKADLKNLSGNVAVMETTSGGWGDPGRAVSPGKDLTPQRLGANPPIGLVKLHEQASAEVLGACGVPVELLTSGEGTALREAHRRFLFSTISPLGRTVSEELSAKFETSVSLGWAELMASDIAGRARAFQSLVGGGMQLERAAALSGLLSPED